jgi:hypothetical protein
VAVRLRQRGLLRRLGLIAGVALAAAVGLAVPSAHAGFSLLPTCGSTSHPFSQFGDAHAYYGFSNNGFESGSGGWTVRGASVVLGNEPWYVNGTGKSSLSLPPGASVASPLVCINLLNPYWRMFVRSNGANGPLHAQVVFYGLTGNITGIVNFVDFSSRNYGTWQPSGKVLSALALPLLTRSAQLRLTSGATSGSWQVDDVFVDPWASRG